jgi:hypothetical protein
MVQVLRFALIAAAALVMAVASTPSSADEYVTNLGPVGVNEPIVANFGGRRVFAFFVPEHGACVVNTMMWMDDAGVDTPYTAFRVRMMLWPGEMSRFDDARMSMSMLCGADASTLEVVNLP